MANVKTGTTPNAGEDAETRHLIDSTLGGSVIWHSHPGDTWPIS